MCYERRRAEACADESASVLCLCVVVVCFITVCLYVCFITAGPITKLFAWGEEESGGHVLVVELSLLHKFSLSEDSKTVLLVTIRFCVSLISCPQPRMQGP